MSYFKLTSCLSSSFRVRKFRVVILLKSTLASGSGGSTASSLKMKLFSFSSEMILGEVFFFDWS